MNEDEQLIPANLRHPETSRTNVTGSKTLADYKVIKEIGDGSFSVVYSAKELFGLNRTIALKMCFKRQLIKEGLVPQIHREKRALARIASTTPGNAFVTTLFQTLQDSEHLYFVVTYAEYGDLFHIMLKQQEKKFSYNVAQFLLAQTLSGIQYLHSLSILHRDLKPENLLITSQRYVLISDFGCVKDLQDTTVEPPKHDRRRRFSFVGTAQYIPPEMLKGDTISEAIDIWSFAVIVYQLLTGSHCFHDESEYLIFKRIQSVSYTIPEDFPADAADLVRKILIEDPTKRLGVPEMGGQSALKKHQFFETIDWDALSTMESPLVINE